VHLEQQGESKSGCLTGLVDVLDIPNHGMSAELLVSKKIF